MWRCTSRVSPRIYRKGEPRRSKRCAARSGCSPARSRRSPKRPTGRRKSMSIARRSRRTEDNIWPAFVDALGQLVIAITFLLLIFTVAQFLTTDALSGRDQALQRLTQQINELTELLNLEKRGNDDLRLNVA